MDLKPCIFLDRDGVINRERGDYTFRVEDFEILKGVIEALELAKGAGYLLIVITNQAGIAKGIYKETDVLKCHQYLQTVTGDLIDDLFFCPHHPTTTTSLLRKPDSLMLEKAIAKWSIDVESSYMIGDSDRDMEAAARIGVKGLLVKSVKDSKLVAQKKQHQSLFDAVLYILSQA